MSRLTRDGTAEPVSRGQILRHECGQGNIHFPCSADHDQDWQPYPVDPYSCYMCDHTVEPYDNEVLHCTRYFFITWYWYLVPFFFVSVSPPSCIIDYSNRFMGSINFMMHVRPTHNDWLTRCKSAAVNFHRDT